MAMMPAMPASDAGAMPMGGGAGDLSQGYCLELSVLPDGTFKVSWPEAIEDKAKDDEGEAPYSEIGEDFTSIGEALKAIIGKIKDNPVGGDAQKNFEAGYGQS